MRQSRRKEGTYVPGGFIFVDNYRGKNPLLFWMRVFLTVGNPIGILNLKRDVVIESPSTGAEIYREGPFDELTVNRAIKRIAIEINAVGLDEFLSRRRDDVSPSGALSVKTEDGTRQFVTTSIHYYWDRVVGALRRRP